MNKIQKQIYDSVVRPSIDALPKTTLGTIDEYNADTNIASVIIEGLGHNRIYKRFQNVPVQISHGAKYTSPYPGDIVVLEFFNGNGNTPVITGFADRTYAVTTRDKYERHIEAGGAIPDFYKTREGKKWITEQNKK